MSRMLDIIKKLEQEPAGVTAPLPASGSTAASNELLKLASLPRATPSPLPAVGQSPRTSTTAGKSFLQALIASNPPAPQPAPCIAAPSLSLQQPSTTPAAQPAPIVAPIAAPVANRSATTSAVSAPLAASEPPAIVAALALPAPVPASPATVTVPITVALPSKPPTPTLGVTPGTRGTVDFVPTVDFNLPSMRTEPTRLERMVKTALADPKRSAELEQLARRLTAELRPDAGRCWMLAAAGDDVDTADLAAHIAVTLAGQVGEILLIDANTESSLTAGLIGSERSHDTGRGWHASIVPTAWPNLFLLPAATLANADSSEAWTKLLGQAERRFRVVLIDGGSVEAARCCLLSRLCDASFLVIRLGVTQATQARQSLKQLQSHGARVLGTIATSSLAN